MPVVVIAPRARALIGLTLAAAVALEGRRGMAAPDRMAVLVVADDDALADNLAEVAISHLAKGGGGELVGVRELRGRLPEAQTSESLRACLSRPTCLADLGAAAGAGRAVIGDVRREGNGFRIDLSLTDLRTGTADARVSDATATSEVGLIAAVRHGLDELLARVTPAPAAPVAALPAAAPSPSAGRGDGGPPAAATAVAPAVDLSAEASVPRARHRSALPYLAVGTSACAVVSFSAAAVAGLFAISGLNGNNRAELQTDLNRHDQYATTANVLLGVGTACAAVAAFSLYRWWRSDRNVASHAGGEAPAAP